MTPVDNEARLRAVDPGLSVCVSAPAGSGKTALLVQRFLGLLARVSEPESVVAITFTRKAAAEMRARVVGALQGAAEGVKARNPHEEALMAAARAVAEHDGSRGWGLLDNPSRLRIQTIDSFCGYLTRQMPVLSGCGGQVTATDDSRVLYREAIENFLHGELNRRQDDKARDIETLLLHLDNNWDSALELLSKLLQRREQWQPVFGGGGLHGDAQQNVLEITESLVRYRLELLQERFAAHMQQLITLMDYREQNLKRGLLFSGDCSDLASWRGVAALLLTGKGEWRKTVTVRDGFPAGKGEPAELKAQMLALLSTLREEDDGALLGELRQVVLLPDVDDEPAHWDVLVAVTRLLPRLGAELLLVFQQKGEVDHAQIAMAALDALGTDREPTDLALRLDHSIEHLLVDEFQDTSSVQFELIRRLTRGWHEHNEANPQGPRTLLLVGDAMQSIYGFREANVGLFIRARNEGVGDLSLTPLDLQVNFRSQQGLVEWTNAHFQRGFPQVDDAQLGAVQFREAIAARAPDEAPEFALFTGDGGQAAEIEALCDKLAEGVARDDVESIAVLGRSRTQLRPILAALRARDIDVAARDLDTLAQRPLIRDLLTLTTVLCDRFDRFAWLSLLRTPAIALDNADLLRMASHCPTAADFRDREITRDTALQAVSRPGQQRLGQLQKLLAWADHYKDRLALRVWVEECWLFLGGAASLASDADLRDTERFLQCLEELEVDQAPLNGRSLATAVEALYASPGDERCKVEVMTLHKAKGLEFDWVFIPALAKSTGGQDKELLLWDEFVLPGAPPSFLLDIRDTAEGGANPRLYDYLKAQAKQKRDYEAARLFYVGCTRAADYLWLGAALSFSEAKDSYSPPGSGSLLSVIWPSIEHQASVTHVSLDEDAVDAPTLGYRRLRELPDIAVVAANSPASPLELSENYLARALGTAVHRCIEALIYKPELPECCDEKLRGLLRVALIEAGADRQALPELVLEGASMLDRLLGDSWARWALSAQRRERAAELPLTIATGTGAQQLILDYSFLDEEAGERWVIDYKTAIPGPGEDVRQFVMAQLESYGEQLARYFEALNTRFDEPVRCALYFPALGRHAEWHPTGAGQ
ncbi:UvrD-helicase domain-containing protein [Congregibacter litoralis]|uniref:DNA 3'-5' helicase n=1 Tax=Congregibacter litoralis KT71 TaxID=314285 RepID=A4A4G9_9GAMM|nr:UvrD-helicase domain-containing protein [Congregibacter litoralis]EAQ99104.1 ATP-dependent exoDNAse beta subunit (contains helicase and exonuclease domain protein) [Congregibacter litoralis KT71]